MLHIHSAFCTEQNKNSNIFDYQMSKVAHNYHKRIMWNSMKVQHTQNCSLTSALEHCDNMKERELMFSTMQGFVLQFLKV